MADITVKDIVKSYDGREVLRSVSFAVRSGDFLSIVGESGSGKSTLLGIMGGVLRPDSGQVLIGDTDVAALSERELAVLRRTKIGYVYQFFNLIPTMTVRDNIFLPVRLAGGKIADYEARAEELLRFMRLEAVRDSYPATLSGGEQQRVAILRSLLYSPEVIFLDEPTGNLDSENATNVMELLAALNKEYGVTVVQVTHSEIGTRYGNSIIRIKDGRIEICS